MRHNRVLVSPGVLNIILQSPHKRGRVTEVFESRIDRVVLVGVDLYRRMDRRWPQMV